MEFERLPRTDDYGEMTGIKPGYIKRADLAWYCSHHHNAAGENVPYRYSYLFAYPIDLPAGAKTITLPDNDKIRILAISVADENRGSEAGAAALRCASSGGSCALNPCAPPSSDGGVSERLQELQDRVLVLLCQFFKLLTYMACLAAVPHDRVVKGQGCGIVHQSRTQADSP